MWGGRAAPRPELEDYWSRDDAGGRRRIAEFSAKRSAMICPAAHLGGPLRFFGYGGFRYCTLLRSPPHQLCTASNPGSAALRQCGKALSCHPDTGSTCRAHASGAGGSVGGSPFRINLAQERDRSVGEVVVGRDHLQAFLLDGAGDHWRGLLQKAGVDAGVGPDGCVEI